MVKSLSPIPPLMDTPRESSHGRKGKSLLVATDREKLERSDEDGSRARSEGSQKEWGAVRAVWSHVGNREDFLGCNTPPLHPLTAGRGQSHGGKSMGRKILL